MNRKYLPVILLAGTILFYGSEQTSAHGLLRSSCGAVSASCGSACAAPCATPCAAPCVVAAPAPVVMQKVKVTEYVPETYLRRRSITHRYGRL